MTERVILLIVPGLRERDLEQMPALRELAVDTAPLAPSFPSVSPVVQTCMLTGLLPQDHGIVSSLAFDPDSQEVSERREIRFSDEPIWQTIRGYHASLRCALIGLCPFAQPEAKAAWLHQHPDAKTPAAILAQLANSMESGDHLICARLPHLDQPGHEHGPGSAEFAAAREQLNQDVRGLVAHATQLANADGGPPPLWIVASEYVIRPVRRVIRPNLLLQSGGYQNFARAMNDHQSAHIFLRAGVADHTAEEIAQLFRDVEGIAEVLDASAKVRRDIDHPDAGDLVLVAEPDATFVDTDGIDAGSRQPGGTHGAPAETLPDRGVILVSEPGVLLGSAAMSDFDVAGLVLRQFGI